MPNVPGFVLKLLFGELATAILEGSRASSKKLQDAGFHFKFRIWRTLLKDLLKK